MTNINTKDTVGSIVAKQPALARVFEQFEIDYCCGGKLPLEDACRAKGLDTLCVVDALARLGDETDAKTHVDAASMTLTELADHIEQTHHVYLRSELPRLDAMTEKVASVHGDKEPRLHEVRETFLALAAELSSHMMKEERILFPMARQLEACETAPAFHCGSVQNPIRQMEHEHDEAGAALERLRNLTNSFTPPEWACNTYRAMLDALAQLERDLHLHIHKENNVLFPRTHELEQAKSR